MPKLILTTDEGSQRLRFWSFKGFSCEKNGNINVASKVETVEMSEIARLESRIKELEDLVTNYKAIIEALPRATDYHTSVVVCSVCSKMVLDSDARICGCQIVACYRCLKAGNQPIQWIRAQDLKCTRCLETEF